MLDKLEYVDYMDRYCMTKRAGELKMKTEVAKFLKGEPVKFKSFSGADCVATFGLVRDLGISGLKIQDANGRTLKHIAMGRNEAETFFINL